jgi:hypothetical protein
MRIAPLRSPAFLVAVALSVLFAGCDSVEFEPVSRQPFSCDSESWNTARNNPYRFIAHAGGQIDGRRYTNSREALDLAYENGLRLFEIDLIKTRDGHLVAAHDWDSWRNATGSEIVVPSHQQFKETLLFETYQPLDLADLDRWFAQHTDSYLVTDKVTDFRSLIEGFTHKGRLIVEVFSLGDYGRAREEGVRLPMLSLRAALANDGEDKVIALFRTQPVKFVAVSSKVIGPNKELLRKMRRNHTCVFVFTSSDSQFLKSHFESVVYGAYTDGWNVNSGMCKAAKCDTY